jgi:hypothetical protein
LSSFFYNSSCSISKHQVSIDQNQYRTWANEVLVDFPQVKIWDPINLLCKEERCPVTQDGYLLYKDVNNHLTTYASEYLGKSLVDTLDPKN